MSGNRIGRFDGKDGTKPKDKLENPKKIVVRHLPPSLTKETFIEQVSPLPEYSYFRFSKGDYSLGPHAYSRAYIEFKDQNDIFSFSDKFDGYVFVDARGNEYQAMVEFCPHQRIPKKPKKEDSRKNTIESDSDYLRFLDNLSSKTFNHIGLEQMLSEIDSKAKEKENLAKQTTPLIESLVRKREERQRVRVERSHREQRRREAEERKEMEKKKKLKEKRERERERKEEDNHKRKEKKHLESKKTSGDDNFSKKDKDENVEDGQPSKSSAKSSDRSEKSSRSKSSSYYKNSDRRKAHSDEKSSNRGEKMRNRDRPQREIYVAGKKDRKNSKND